MVSPAWCKEIALCKRKSEPDWKFTLYDPGAQSVLVYAFVYALEHDSVLWRRKGYWLCCVAQSKTPAKTLWFSDSAKGSKKMQIENPIKNCVSHTLADITKTKDASGYNPEYSLEEGIRELM